MHYTGKIRVCRLPSKKKILVGLNVVPKDYALVIALTQNVINVHILYV